MSEEAEVSQRDRELGAHDAFDAFLDSRIATDEIAVAVQAAEIDLEGLRVRALEHRDKVVRQVAPEWDQLLSARAALQHAENQFGSAAPTSEPAQARGLVRLMRWFETASVELLRRLLRLLERVGISVSDDLAPGAGSAEAAPESPAGLEETFGRGVEVARLRSEYEAAWATAQQLLSTAIDEVLRSILNEEVRGRLGTRLRLLRVDGLAQVIDERLEVTTKGLEDLRVLLRRMRGGAVGVSGSRGAGKTTAIRRFCEGREEIGEKPLVTVMVSAPVVYDSRDFIMYLFAELCRRAGAQSPPATPSTGRHDGGPLAPVGWVGLTLARTVAPIVALAGLAGFLTAVIPTIAGELIWGSAALLGGAAVGWPFVGVVRLDRAPLSVIVIRAAQKYLSVALVAGGVGLMVAGALYAQVSVGAVRAAAVFLLASAVGLAAVATFQRLRYLGEAGPAPPWPPRDATDLVTLASLRLEDLRFQQTYTRGWSGGLTLPVVGLQAGVSGSSSLARHPMTFPELIGRFGEFLALATTDHDVVVGIDELDKLESDETANRFLNDLKAAFGVGDSYFLVSVSEDAMSRFERRGLPFRDVFDSTFDEIVRITPLSLLESQRVLGKRIIGMPIIYSALCHVLSGGVPRDLVRNARRLVETQHRLQGVDHLETLTAALVSEELGGKIYVTSYAARAAQLPEPLLSRFTEWLDELAKAHTDAASLDAFCATVEQLSAVTLADADLDEAGQRARATVLRMGLEITAYAYFVATVLRFFHNGMDEAQVKNAADGGQPDPMLERLAYARGAFTINAHSAWLAASHFRGAAGLDTVDLPEIALA